MQNPEDLENTPDFDNYQEPDEQDILESEWEEKKKHWDVQQNYYPEEEKVDDIDVTPLLRPQQYDLRVTFF